MKRVLKNAGLALAATGVTLVVAELAIRAFVTIQLVGSSVTIYDPVYGSAVKPNARIRQTTPEYDMVARTNSLGFRGAEPESFPEGSIMFLGDSFTFGVGVDDDEVYPALVTGELDKRFGNGTIPVINAGLGNTAQGRWVKFLKREGAKFAPRVVVLQFFDNDFEDNIRSRQFELTEGDELRELAQAPQPSGRRIQEIIEAVPGLTRLHLVGLLRQAYHARSQRAESGSDGPASEDQAATERRRARQIAEDRLTYRLSDAAITICREAGWPVVALVVGIEGDRLHGLTRILDGREVPFAVVPAKGAQPDLYFRMDGHWNARGHQYAAERATELLLNESLP